MSGLPYELSIDSHERDHVFKEFRDAGVPHKRATLDVGDFILASSPTQIAVIIERKTWGDLASSLGNNHLAEQMSRMVDKCRLLGARPMLLVEEENVRGWEGSTGALSNKFIDCCLVKYVVEGISVLRTRNISHTRDVVAWLLQRCKDGKIPEFVPGLKIAAEAGAQRFRKKDFGGSGWQVMLSSVQGVSKAMAKRISAKFPNAKSLITAIEAQEELGLPGVGKVLIKRMREALVN
jgi:ERCC4-type nuclease